MHLQYSSVPIPQLTLSVYKMNCLSVLTLILSYMIKTLQILCILLTLHQNKNNAKKKFIFLLQYNDSCIDNKEVAIILDYGSLDCTLREGNGNPLQYSCLENPMDRGAWQAAVRGVAKSRARLSDFTFTFHFHALEKEMATHSSVLAWRIPGKGEHGGLPSMGLHRVGHD